MNIVGEFLKSNGLTIKPAISEGISTEENIRLIFEKTSSAEYVKQVLFRSMVKWIGPQISDPNDRLLAERIFKVFNYQINKVEVISPEVLDQFFNKYILETEDLYSFIIKHYPPDLAKILTEDLLTQQWYTEALKDKKNLFNAFNLDLRVLQVLENSIKIRPKYQVVLSRKLSQLHEAAKRYIEINQFSPNDQKLYLTLKHEIDAIFIKNFNKPEKAIDDTSADHPLPKNLRDKYDDEFYNQLASDTTSGAVEKRKPAPYPVTFNGIA